MEDLQSALQGILSDPEQMARVAALAESLGLKPPDVQTNGETPGPNQAAEAFPNCHSERSEESVPPSSFAGNDGINIGEVMNLLSASSGSEARLLTTLRPTLGPEGQSRVDRALRAAKLSRLAGALLTRRRGERV